MKEKVYLALGMILLTSGLSMIHIGLGMALLGVMFLGGAYIEYTKEE